MFVYAEKKAKRVAYPILEVPKDQHKLEAALVADLTQIAKIGRSDESLHAERLLDYIRKAGEVEWETAFRHVHQHFPGLRDYENVLAALIKAKLVYMVQKPGGKIVLKAGS